MMGGAIGDGPSAADPAEGDGVAYKGDERNDMDAMTRLQEAFTTGLDLDPGAVDWPTLTYRGIPEWDSVAHMQVVAEIEDAFDIMLETDDVIGMSSFAATVTILAKYGVTIG